jgi:hypothetical protein
MDGMALLEVVQPEWGDGDGLGLEIFEGGSESVEIVR